MFGSIYLLLKWNDNDGFVSCISVCFLIFDLFGLEIVDLQG